MSNHTALIQDLFANITREGWSTKFNDALADDLVWVATGSSPVAGTYEGKQVYLEKIIKRLRLGRSRKEFPNTHERQSRFGCTAYLAFKDVTER
jgi:ketosteroid isomerase-like protein